jgi:hypothetical protein
MVHWSLDGSFGLSALQASCWEGCQHCLSSPFRSGRQLAALTFHGALPQWTLSPWGGWATHLPASHEGAGRVGHSAVEEKKNDTSFQTLSQIKLWVAS